ncbi:cytochrome P450 [Suillus lakei]|nr:cytochrome P450 [Suillus lakei]
MTLNIIILTSKHSHQQLGCQVAYGYQTNARNDPLVRVVVNAVAIGLEVMTPERAILLRLFPFLLKLPDWCWGSSIKRDAEISTNYMTQMLDLPFRYAQEHMVGIFFQSSSVLDVDCTLAKAENTNLGQFSMVAENLQRMEKLDQPSKSIFETALKNTAATAVMAQPLQTTSTLMAFALAMVLHPDVQRRAQVEIDSVTGGNRLPTFEDRASLPYVESVMRENLRWHPVVPLGIPHATLSDDIYNGYFIPKGATVMCNTWGIARDEKRYPSASHFIPERFLDANGVLTDDDPAGYVFGLGRRGCAGRYAADASVWSVLVTMLATVEFSSAKDDQGNVIEFTPQFTTGLAQYLVFLRHSILH